MYETKLNQTATDTAFISILTGQASVDISARCRCLVGGIPTPLKNMKVSWDYEIPN